MGKVVLCVLLIVAGVIAKFIFNNKANEYKTIAEEKEKELNKTTARTIPITIE